MGGFAEKEIRVREILLRQSPSQKSEISDCPLYTRGPLGAVEEREGFFVPSQSKIKDF